MSHVEGKFEKRDVIKQYSNFDSQVYAPMTRIGVYLDSGSEQYNVKSKFSTTLNGEPVIPHGAVVQCPLMFVGLMELEENLPIDVIDSRYGIPSARASGGGGIGRDLAIDFGVW
jgi:hypothetical protein